MQVAAYFGLASFGLLAYDPRSKFGAIPMYGRAAMYQSHAEPRRAIHFRSKVVRA